MPMPPEMPMRPAAPAAEGIPSTPARPDGDQDRMALASEPVESEPDDRGADPAVEQAVPASAPDPAIADLLDRICPYLLSEDGTYRSSEPDPDHRCMAQDPPGTLPLAFQERYCLSERHTRCEMYKYAQSAREAALDQEGIPTAKVRSARFRPSVRSVPVALGPSSGGTSDAGAPRRPSTGVLVGGGIAMIIILLVLLAFALDGLAGPGTPDASATPGPVVTSPPATRTPAPVTLAPSAVAPDASADGGASVTEVLLIRYVVQEGERLAKIAEKFETRPQRIRDANPDRPDADPYVGPGDELVIPVPVTMTAEEIEAQPGFDGYVE
jgi:hypothetical protein